MGEQRRVVAEHYPVEKLPEELRAGLGEVRHVTVTIEAEPEDTARPAVARRPLLSYLGAGKGVYPTPEDAVSAIRKLRDEWP
jgi:hypothetical protein